MSRASDVARRSALPRLAVAVTACLLLAGSSWLPAAQANPVYDASTGLYVTGDGFGLAMWRMENGRVAQASTYRILIPFERTPATYATRQEQVLVEPAHTVTIEIPAVYDKDRKLLTPATTRVEQVPAMYQMRTRQVCVEPERIDLHVEGATLLRQMVIPGTRPSRPGVGRAAGTSCGGGGRACGGK